VLGKKSNSNRNPDPKNKIIKLKNTDPKKRITDSTAKLKDMKRLARILKYKSKNKYITIICPREKLTETRLKKTTEAKMLMIIVSKIVIPKNEMTISHFV
jgi:2C-methyl-D-erythritol 2,4-cyclodiphosphate synthase